MTEISASVLVAPREYEMRSFSRPRIGDDEVLLRVEACGICGSDIDQRNGKPNSRYPVIPGHEVVGVVDEIGGRAGEQRQLSVGDRVAVDPFMPCGGCRSCLLGRAEFCTGWNRPHTFGFVPVGEAPAVWGGYATHIYIPSEGVLHPVPAHVAGDVATLFNPLGAGLKWGVDVPGTGVGSTVVVLGSGQRGLACVLANKLAGASLIIATGLSGDAHKLELARRFGADHIINVDADDAVEAVLDLTDGEGVDAVIDTTPGATSPVNDAVKMVRRYGAIVLGGLKGRDVPSFPVDEVVRKAVKMHGVLGIGSEYYRQAVDIIASGKTAVPEMRSHTFDLESAGDAVEALAANDPAEAVINVVIAPTTQSVSHT